MTSTPVATGPVKLAVIPGDGIGQEVTAEALKVLEVASPAGVTFEQTRYDLGAERYLATGEVLPDTVLSEIREHDAILLGAVGGKPNDPSIPPGLLERGLLLRLRFELDHYVNLRPSRIFPGVTSPLSREVLGDDEVDFVVVREGTEGPYTGNGGALRVGTPAEVATEVSVNTAYGVERVVRDAFARAERRPRKKLTLVHKTNVLVHAGSVWWRLTQAVAAEHPDVTVDYMHIDAAMIHMTTNPQRFDVIVTDNLFGDIITDLAGAISGGIGLAASGNINPDRTVDVRAGARLGPRHRGAAGRRPDRGDPVDRAAARPPRPPRGGRAHRGRGAGRPRRARHGAAPHRRGGRLGRRAGSRLSPT